MKWSPVSLPVNGVHGATNIFERGSFALKVMKRRNRLRKKHGIYSVLRLFATAGEYDIVRNFILYTLQLQSWEKTMDCYSPGQGLMPASFKVRTVPLDSEDSATEEVLDADFGEAAIGRVAPVDSGKGNDFKKIVVDYTVTSLWKMLWGSFSARESRCANWDEMILRLCLADGFDMFPTLLVTDGSCMIDRRMGIHGHPLEIEDEVIVVVQRHSFYSALLCAREMLAPEDGSADLIRALTIV
ncbi:hypothetical protein POTOM_061130 [Populus tomentosa]|uniref:Alkaline/neutral invertase n=1 Tax=Populus tomentosa TaxID=118781 RepID=A0A8X7XTM5_POPTO|nr:hypothetical protein POTOM_061130 [Populus tomentosa]